MYINDGNEERQVHLRDYWKILLKHRWTVFSIFFIVVTLTVFITAKTRPVYRATAQILINKEQPNFLSFEDFTRANSSFSDYYHTQYKILKSRTLLGKVVDELNLVENKEMQPLPPSRFDRYKEKTIASVLSFLGKGEKEQIQESSPESRHAQMVNRVSGMLSVEPIRGSMLVNLNVESHSPKIAARIANGIARAYIDQSLGEKKGSSKEAYNWLSEQLVKQKDKLQKSEETLQKYKEQHNIVADREDTSIVFEQLAAVDAAFTAARNRRIEKENRYRKLLEIKNNSDSFSTLEGLVGSDLIVGMKDQLSTLISQQSEMAKKYKPLHPKMIRLKAEIDSSRQSIEEEVVKELETARSEFLIAQSEESILEEQLKTAKSEKLVLDKVAINFDALAREVSTNKTMYENLLTQMEKASLSAELETGNISVVDKAEVPKVPIKPSLKKNLVMAGILGLFLGLGMALFVDYLDNTVKTPEDIERYVGLPFLGPIPKFETMNGVQQRSSSLITHLDPKSTASEAYRSIRTSVLFSVSDKSLNTLLVTSAVAGEGKTTTAGNLAITMAQSESKVILMDADLRRPQVHKTFNCSSTRGLSSILAGQADLDDLIVETSIPNLSVLPSGPIPPNPSEMLGSNKMNELLEQLKKRFDYIIIDTSPVNVVTDACVLARKCDGIIQVVRGGKTSRDFVARARGKLHDVGGNVLGVVINDLSLSKGDYYYQYYHSYYYGGYYGEDRKRHRTSRRKKKKNEDA